MKIIIGKGEKGLPTEKLKELILKKAGMNRGSVFISMGRGSGFENAVRVIQKNSGFGVGLFVGCDYGRTCSGCQVGGIEKLCYSCENFEVFEANIFTISRLENFMHLIGGIIIQPYLVESQEILSDILLKLLKGICLESHMLFVDDETQSPPSKFGKWRNMDADIDMDMIILGSEVVDNLLPIEILIVRDDLVCPIEQEPFHSQIYGAIKNKLEDQSYE